MRCYLDPFVRATQDKLVRPHLHIAIGIRLDPFSVLGQLGEIANLRKFHDEMNSIGRPLPLAELRTYG